MSRRSTPPPAVVSAARTLLRWTARDIARGLARLKGDSMRYYYSRPAELLDALVWFFDACVPERVPPGQRRYLLKNPTPRRRVPGKKPPP